jgi:hypothetical protein
VFIWGLFESIIPAFSGREGRKEPPECGCCPGFIIAGYTEKYKESRKMKC